MSPAILDDLNTPLGQDDKSKPQRRFSAQLASRAVAVLLGIAVLGFVIWAAIVRDPLGGEPIATASISSMRAADTNAAKSPPLPDPQAQPAPPAEPVKAPGTQTITIIDGSSGKRQDVQIPISGDNARRSATDSRLLEPSRHGPIPKIAADGARPADVYAQKSPPEKSGPDGPQIAIVIGGLGAGAISSADALSKLPPAITLAFTPYGSDLDNLAARAREKGHEILLQVPMEPKDRSDIDQGPQTLLSSLSADQNADRLHWAFGRMQGYVGISNLAGARFTASDAALAPVLREVAKRGLIYVDDGSSPGSRAGPIAAANRLPFAKADVVIDATPGAAEIDKALKRLESAARDRGMAVGFASALPASLDRISRWAKTAPARGIVLVPITRIAVRTGSS